MIKQLAGSLTLAAMTIQPALAAPAGCLTSAELRAGARFVLPILIDGVIKKCTPTLASGSYLAIKGAELSKRYAALPGDDSVVATLVAKMDTKGELADLDPAALRAFATVAVTKGMAKDLKPEICPTIDKALELIDPLPAENTVGLFELVMRQVDADKAKAAVRAGQPVKQLLCPPA